MAVSSNYAKEHNIKDVPHCLLIGFQNDLAILDLTQPVWLCQVIALRGTILRIFLTVY